VGYHAAADLQSAHRGERHQMQVSK